MGFKIVWTKKAVQSFSKRVAYLEEHWTEKEILKFTALVNKFLQNLEKQPLMFPKSVSLNYTHSGLLIKEVSLVYRVNMKSEIIELIAFIDNRQNPKKQKY